MIKVKLYEFTTHIINDTAVLNMIVLFSYFIELINIRQRLRFSPDNSKEEFLIGN